MTIHSSPLTERSVGQVGSQHGHRVAGGGGPHLEGLGGALGTAAGPRGQAVVGGHGVVVELRRGVAGAQRERLLQAAQASAVGAHQRGELVPRVRGALCRLAGGGGAVHGGETGVGRAAGVAGARPAAAATAAGEAGVEAGPPGALRGAAGGGRGGWGVVEQVVVVELVVVEGVAMGRREVGGVLAVGLGVVVVATVGGGGVWELAHVLVVLLRRVGPPRRRLKGAAGTVKEVLLVNTTEPHLAAILVRL